MSPLEKRAVRRQHQILNQDIKGEKGKRGKDLRKGILIPRARMLGDEQG